MARETIGRDPERNDAPAASLSGMPLIDPRLPDSARCRLSPSNTAGPSMRANYLREADRLLVGVRCYIDDNLLQPSEA